MCFEQADTTALWLILWGSLVPSWQVSSGVGASPSRDIGGFRHFSSACSFLGFRPSCPSHRSRDRVASRFIFQGRYVFTVDRMVVLNRTVVVSLFELRLV